VLLCAQSLAATFNTLVELKLVEVFRSTDAAGRQETRLKLVPLERAETLKGLSETDLAVLAYVERTE